MPREFDKRQALTAPGSISLGALLTACGRGGSQNSATAVPTADGGRATVSPRTTASSDLAADVYRKEPYASDTGRDAFNSNDRTFDESLVLTTSRDGDGFLGVMTFDVRCA